jgi:hypothetical protein
MMKFLPVWSVWCFGVLTNPLFVGAADPVYDVVIYGGTSAGVTAAIQTLRDGHTAILIEPSQHVGGLTSGGLGMTDSGDNRAIGGMAREFYQRTKRHYDEASAWRQEKPEAYSHYKKTSDAIWRFEPSVAEKILREMLAEAKATVIYGERLDLKAGVVKRGKEITSIKMESGKTYAGKRFIDATYEGDLMAKAGVSYTVGREANAQYGEIYNGVQTKNSQSHQFTVPVDPYVKPGDPKSGLLPGIHGGPPGTEGGADKLVQAYCYRLCMTDDASNRIPWSKPEGYDPLRYELGLRYAVAGNKIWMKPDFMPNRKTDTNNNGGFSMDNIGMNYDYPDGDYATRDKILREHYQYQMGLCYFFANDPRVPENVRKEFSRFGLAKDEFTDNKGWPHQIYVREARRMIGEYVHTELDCRRTRATPSSVGMGSYNMDSHNCQRYVTADGLARNEGDVQKSPGGAYPISYQCLVPKANECTNLLVPVCVSSSHIAYGSIRMEPVFMVLGQSAAAAACISLDASSTVQAVNYDQLKAKLLKEKQVLELTPKAASASGIEAKSLQGTVVDDAAAKRVGEWSEGTVTKGYIGQSYLHDADTDKGAKQVIFTIPVATKGIFTVEIAYTALNNRATNVPVKIATSEGPRTVVLNQQAPTTHEGFFPVGKFSFSPSQPATVTISNEGTDGHVIVDAVRLLAE